MKFFKNLRKLKQEQMREIVRLSGIAGMLLLVASFISAGGLPEASQYLSGNFAHNPGSQTADIFPCSWFGDCSSTPTMSYAISPSATTVYPGQAVTLYWSNYTRMSGVDMNKCSNNPDYGGALGCVISGYGSIGPSSDCYTGYPVPGCDDGSVTVYPTVTTTYYFYSTYWQSTSLYANGWVLPAIHTTVTVVPPPAPVTADASVTATVNVGESATISFHADSTSPPTHCQIDDYRGTSLYDITSCPTSANSKYVTPVFTTPGTYSYQFWYYRGSWTLVKTLSVVVNPVTPLGPCNDIPSSTDVPNSCVTPNPAPGLCIPTGGSYSSATDSCSCPAGKHLSGSSCVNDPLCANGLADSFAPSCTCPSGQMQSGSLCVPLDVCSNIPGAQTVPPAHGSTSGGVCSCDSGYALRGGSCVLAGIIQSFTANPTRVRKGNTATVSWATTNMASCSLSAFSTAGTVSLSSALTSTVTPVINSKTIFTLTCSDDSGESYSSSATVNLVPDTVEN